MNLKEQIELLLIKYTGTKQLWFPHAYLQPLLTCYFVFNPY